MRRLDLDDGPPTDDWQTVDVDGRVLDNGTVCWGKATRQPNGKWQCLANCGGSLCRIEVTITFDKVNQEPPFRPRMLDLD